ncbi:MAG: signal peptidase I [Spirochaetales bacterium]|nr:signal peptidase I [Spirochaetales bacterium]
MYGIDHYKKKKNKHVVAKDIILIYIIAVVFVLLFNSMILQAYKVPSDSMFPAINEGTCVLTNKFAFGPKYPMTDVRIFDGTSGIKRGDIVVFMSNEYFGKSVMFRSFSSFIYTLTFSLVDISHFQKSYESNIYIKRVIGLPGDRISFKLVNEKVVVYINGVEEKKVINIDYKLIDETEENSPLLSNMILQNETVLKDGEFYVLGDNRISSSDSRIYGPIRSKQIIGKAVLKYWPLRNFGAVR